jgi:hypothetical protein
LSGRNRISGDHVDLAIEHVIARRAVGGSAGTPAASPFSTDEELVAALAALTEMDWPADEVCDRIAMTVAAGQLATTSAGPETAAAPERLVRGGARYQ